jgi:hypothetical protein
MQLACKTGKKMDILNLHRSQLCWEKDGAEIHILCDVYFNIRREDRNNREPMLKLGWKEKILILTAGWK